MKLIVIIIVALAGLYELALNIVKYRSANNPTPQNVADVYDAETYKTWKKYSAAPVFSTDSVTFTSPLLQRPLRFAFVIPTTPPIAN